jgi:carboxypeptidase C (cathepsin A)
MTELAMRGTVWRNAAMALVLCAMPPAAHAQRAATPAAPPTAPARATPRALPAESVTHHTLDLPGRTLHFTATVGSIRLADDKGDPQADIVFTAYTLDGADPASRPVTLAVNGGPGASTAWLQLGVLGPWRLPMDGAAISPSAAPVVQPNAETWLDFTDLVFFDPPGTGFARIVASGDEARKNFWGVNGDIAALAEAQRRWLAKAERLVSPKYIVGESYGGFRGPRLVRALLESQGVGVRGLVLISPVLDLGGRSSAFDPLLYVERLPSMVAAAREGHGPVDRAAMADVEAYAVGPYLSDLLRGLHDPQAVARVSDKVAALTELDPALVREHAGQLDFNVWLRERLRARHAVASAYDTTVTIADPFSDSSFSRWPDPILDGLRGPVTSAMLDLYARTLHWLPDAKYELLNDSVARRWDYGSAQSNRPESASMLRSALALDPQLHVLIAHGLTDIVTPYFATQLVLNTLPQFGDPDRVRLAVFPGGHMFYARDASRQAFRAAAVALFEGK